MKAQPTRDTGSPHVRFAVLAIDIALFTVKNNHLYVRLMNVRRPPHFPNAKGLPGGLIDHKETAEETARRLMKSKAHIESKALYLEQLATFSAVDRDPFDRVVAVAYLGLVSWSELSDEERLDTPDAWWQRASTVPKLAYDHDDVFSVALGRLRSRAKYTTVLSRFMPKEFTLTELENVYECVLKTDLDKRNFRKKILKLKVLKKLTRKRTGKRARPAQLFAFASSKIVEMP